MPMALYFINHFAYKKKIHFFLWAFYGVFMKLKISSLVALASISLLCGCLSSPRVLTQGGASMVEPHIPKANDAKQVVGVQLAGRLPSEGMNMEQNYSIGGNVSYRYHIDPSLPFFISAAVGGFYGEAEFACQEDCDSRLVKTAWSALEDKSMDYFSFQQRLRAGVEFGKGVVLGGLALGVQFNENFGDWEDARQNLVEINAARGNEDSWGVNFHWNVFLGFRLGSYGTIMLEDGMIYAFELDADDKIDMFLHTLYVTYVHPTGFFGGVAKGEDGLSLSVGKTFAF